MLSKGTGTGHIGDTGTGSRSTAAPGATDRGPVDRKLGRIVHQDRGGGIPPITAGRGPPSVEITDVHVPDDLIQELSVIAQSRRSAQAKIAEADAEKQVSLKLQEASELLSDRAMEMYRLNVLERIGREEGSQIVVYGLSGGDQQFEKMTAATSAATRLENK